MLVTRIKEYANPTGTMQHCTAPSRKEERKHFIGDLSNFIPKLAAYTSIETSSPNPGIQ